MISNLEYKEKYLKYKKKYIDLKKSMKGGMQAATAAEAQGAAGPQVASIDPNNLLIIWYQKASYKKPHVGHRFTMDSEVSLIGINENTRAMGNYLDQAIKIIMPFFVKTDRWGFGITRNILNEIWSTTPFLILTLIYTNYRFASWYYITLRGEIMNIDPIFMAKIFLVSLKPEELIAGLQMAISMLPQEIEVENKELPNWNITKYLEETLQYKRDPSPNSEQVVINSLIYCFGLGSTHLNGLQASYLQYVDFLKERPKLVSLYIPILQKFIDGNNTGVIYKNYKGMFDTFDLTLKSIAEELLKRMS